ncbi:TPA: PTS sugar transporter subunit IIC [bacterium]|nr:PTS sugar transporter subunit IIC [bacterium]
MAKKNETLGSRILDYFVKTLNGMAYGLFATLIIGVIIGKIGEIINIDQIITLANAIKAMMPIGIGLGVAWSLNLTGLKLISAGVAGGIAVVSSKSGSADPVVAYLCSLGAIEVSNLVLRKKTPVDIILIPLLYSFVAFAITLLIGTPVANMMNAIGMFIMNATELHPFWMGMVVSLVMGMALTAPISSAAIAISIGLEGLAGGAALAGCCVQMIGFAVMSRKDNDIGVIISVAIGTSMLQFKNILKKPIIWLPTMIVSLIVGPLATLVFKAESTPIGSGMGTSGLVGQFAIVDAMGFTMDAYITIGLLHFVLPFVLVYIVDVIFRKYGLIKKGDLKI